MSTSTLAETAFRSVAKRPVAILAALISVTLATALIASFARLVATSRGSNVSDADGEVLIIMGLVVGSWGAIIALFSLTSTIGLTVRQRSREIAILRTVGGSPSQVRRMIMLETLFVSIVGVVVGTLGAIPGSQALLSLLQRNDMVASEISLVSGWITSAMVALIVMALSLIAARLSCKNSSSATINQLLTQSETERAGISRIRAFLGVLLIGAGISMMVVTLTIMRDAEDTYAPMQTSGSAALFVAIGISTFASSILRTPPKLLPWISKRENLSMQMTTATMTQKSDALGGMLGSIVTFVAVSVGVLMMVSIDGRTLEAIAPDIQEARTITTITATVVGMIAVFAAIMLINVIVASINQRRSEFARLLLIGAERRHILSMIRTEALTLAGVGVVLGILASMATMVPYSIVREEGLLPNGTLWLPFIIVILATAIALGTAMLTTKLTLRQIRRTGIRVALDS